MSVEVNPVGTHCRMRCAMCYQINVRRGSHNARPAAVDHERVRAAVEAASPGSGGFTLFGGEPALASLEDLEKLWAFGLERYGKNGIQTAGADLTDAHHALFLRYKVTVGFSIEGPDELNDARRYGPTVETTRAATARSIAALERCLSEGVPCSLITTLSRVNASSERLPRLVSWFSGLAGLGLRDARLHALERDGRADSIALSVGDAVAAFRAVHAAETGLRFDLYRDMRAMLAGEDDSVSCVWSSCDPLTTTAVHGIEADGSRSLCHRVNKDGRSWLPSSGGPRFRQLALAATPQEDGGCAGCRFLVACKGQCPGTSIGGDWRKRSADCPLWFALLEDAERGLLAEGRTPVSLRPDLPEVEARMRRAWAAGLSPSVRGCLEDRYRGAAARGQSGGHDDHDDHDDHADSVEVLAVMAGVPGGEEVR